MKLRKLIANLPIEIYKGNLDAEITGVCTHSKLVAPGNLFIAKKGFIEDGSKYVEEAISAGAAAVLSDMPNPFLKGVVQLLSQNTAAVEGELAARFYDYPSESLYMIGITGTKGKTTITYLIKHLFDMLGMPCGLIGTIEYLIGQHHLEADRTTPDAITNQKLLREMIHQGCQAAVMEVSSHGLAQNRCASINFEQAIFTNLSQDHLDYHLTMEAYAAEKEKLFSTLTPEKTAIVNLESPWTPMMLDRCKAKILTYGFSPRADLFADALSLDSQKTEFSVHFQGETIRMEWGMIGRYNVLNGLAALAACLKKGFTLAQLKPLLQKFKGVPGRLEKIENFRGIHIYVDYAHSPDALEKVLNCLREIKKGRMITVFGCGGDRDKGKRPKMGKIAEEGSDFTIITSDNPRSEHPENICDEIASGFSGSNFCVIIDRQKAIEKAIEMANPADLILIAGKGHEKYQQFSYQTIPFDDRVIAQKIVNKVSVG